MCPCLRGDGLGTRDDVLGGRVGGISVHGSRSRRLQRLGRQNKRHRKGRKW